GDLLITEVKIVDKLPNDVFALPVVPKLTADQLKDKLAKSELKSLEGAWKAISGKLDGKDAPPPKEGIHMILEHEKYTWYVGEKAKDQGKFGIDGTKRPKTMDIMTVVGVEKGKTRPAIF